MAATFKLLATATPSGVGTVTFNSIPNTYTDLYVNLDVLNTFSNSYAIDYRYNSYAGSNVRQMRITQRYNGSARVNQVITQGSNFVPSPYANYSNRGAGIIEMYIPQYSSSNTFWRSTTHYVNYGNSDMTSGANQWIFDYAWGIQQITSSINSITFSVGSGSINGTIKLYGIVKGTT